MYIGAAWVHASGFQSIVQPRMRLCIVQEAVQGTRRRLQMGGMRGMPPVNLEVQIPAGVDTGESVTV
jgi:hypothetical protein